MGLLVYMFPCVVTCLRRWCTLWYHLISARDLSKCPRVHKHYSRMTSTCFGNFRRWFIEGFCTMLDASFFESALHIPFQLEEFGWEITMKFLITLLSLRFAQNVSLRSMTVLNNAGKTCEAKKPFVLSRCNTKYVCQNLVLHAVKKS